MNLMGFAKTELQKEVVKLREEGVSWNDIAHKQNRADRDVRRSYEAVLARAALKGFSPDHDMSHTVPDPFVVKGVSTYYNDEGKPVGQWVKSSVEDERKKKIMEAFVDSLAEDIKPAKPVKLSKAPREESLLNTYILTDYHIGMLAWGEETGDDWDIDIAERTLISWFKKGIELSPKADTAVFAQIGDLMHFDSYTPVTVASGHILDADSRLQKIIRCVIRVTRTIIDMLLSKYKHVHIKWCDANHDPASAAWMREFLVSFYEKEPRVDVDNSPDTYYCYEWGKVALFFHHGHKRKVSNVDTVFAGKFREIFGRTKYNYAHMGHYHSIDVKETNLMVVSQHRTLAAPDAYAAKGGYISGRDSVVITYHKDYGEVSRQTISYKLVSDER